MACEVVSFYDVQNHWDPVTQTWDDPKFFYIGRANPRFNLPASVYGNPFHVRDGNKGTAIAPFAALLKQRPVLVEQAKWQLKDKTLVCYCRRKPRQAGEAPCCHGDILKQIVDDDDRRPDNG